MAKMEIQRITKTSPMQRALNKGLMIAWINNDLVNNCHCDVRTSFCYYDADEDFVFATENELSDKGKAQLLKHTRVRFWSKGIV